MHEQLDEHARNSKDAAIIARNRAKWAAAIQWADRHSAEFQVLNENDLFSYNNTKKGRIHPVKTWSPTHATKNNAAAPKAKAAGKVAKKQASSKRMPTRRTTTGAKIAKARRAMSARVRKA